MEINKMNDIKIIVNKISDHMFFLSNNDDITEARHYLNGYIDAVKERNEKPSDVFDALKNLVDILFDD